MLERIEALKERERERQEPLAEVAAMAEEHGLNVGALMAEVGG